jgi:hypothetical protein
MMGRFQRFINDIALKEILLHGRKFTWSNQHESPTLVRLDRVLCTVEWEDLFLDCLLQSMASNDSDHCPLLLSIKDNYSGTKHFHFEAFWPKLLWPQVGIQYPQPHVLLLPWMQGLRQLQELE